ncbi:MAG: 2-dehydro-3-deoxy-6-phosphogalactonate aldolase, partial [Betaproteobacteria bacterium]|nr:2-dehydro-3-deoxy-6-phosphogalactonate aldolase [Betaproteobacteria bacterium]
MTPLLTQFQAHMDRLPLVAILRGLSPEEALDVGRATVNAGFHILEVPLNSPDPLRSIQILAAAFPNVLVGAGTVTTAQQVRDIKAA